MSDARDYCLRCGQRGHVAASCKVKLPPVIRSALRMIKFELH